MQTLVDLEIREGDILTVDGRDYPIKAVETFKTGRFSPASFARMANVRASVSRNVHDGQGSYPKTLLEEDLPCTPLDPISGRESAEYREVLSTPTRTLKTYVASASGFYKLLIEDLKK
jgi:hypothetical protein